MGTANSVQNAAIHKFNPAKIRDFQEEIQKHD